MGHLIAKFKSGLGRLQAPSRKPRRVYIPPDVVEKIHVWALTCDVDTPAQRRMFRAAVAVVLTFCTFARGGTLAHLPCGAVRRSAAGLTITLDHEKGKHIESTARTITFPPGAVPGLDALLDRWEALRGAPKSSNRSYFSLPRERGEWAESQVNAWVQSILAHLDFAAPDGESWSGHSLRKGAASGADAEGVQLHVIAFIGNWSIKSKTIHDYIDPTCPRTPACLRYFGWLRRHPHPG